MPATSLRGSIPPSAPPSSQDSDLVSLYKKAYLETPDGQRFDHNCVNGIPNVGDSVSQFHNGTRRYFLVTKRTSLKQRFGEPIPDANGIYRTCLDDIVTFPLLHVRPLN